MEIEVDKNGSAFCLRFVHSFFDGQMCVFSLEKSEIGI